MCSDLSFRWHGCISQWCLLIWTTHCKPPQMFIFLLSSQPHWPPPVSFSRIMSKFIIHQGILPWSIPSKWLHARMCFKSPPETLNFVTSNYTQWRKASARHALCLPACAQLPSWCIGRFPAGNLQWDILYSLRFEISTSVNTIWSVINTDAFSMQKPCISKKGNFTGESKNLFN